MIFVILLALFASLFGVGLLIGLVMFADRLDKRFEKLVPDIPDEGELVVDTEEEGV